MRPWLDFPTNRSRHTFQPTRLWALAGFIFRPWLKETHQAAPMQPQLMHFHPCTFQVWESVSPRLAQEPVALEWLKKNTRPLDEQLGA